MKHYLLIVLFALVVMRITAQDYLISFTATGDTTLGDTIKINNLMSGETTTLLWGDTLHLTTPTGIIAKDMNDRTVCVFPNPMKELSTLQFNTPENGDVVLHIVDLAGKSVIETRIFLKQGEHSFRISGINPGVYFVTVSGKSFRYSSKLISQGNSKSNPGIEFLSSNTIPKGKRLKSSESIIDMPYTEGDRLLFKGIAGQYSTLVTDVPTGSKTINFNFVLCKDFDGNNYTTVTIGSQVWMAENLKTTCYNDGSPIPLVTGVSAWANLNTPAYCWYDNDSAAYINLYGALYNWYAVGTGKLAPEGWHVPTDDEWTTLTTYLGGDSIAGGKMKSTGTVEAGTGLWNAPNTDATNESGFSALPGGYRGAYGSFWDMGNAASWWSSTAAGPYSAWSRLIGYDGPEVTRLGGGNNGGPSVRCIKN